jgi:hypothetical protein
MSSGQARLVGGPLAIVLAGLVMAGCGGTARSRTGAVAGAEPVTRAQAFTYARAVNLRAGDLPGFSASEAEAEAPKPGPASLQGARCTGALDPRGRVAAIDSRMLETGRARSSRFIRSRIEVWPTHADVLFNSTKAHTARGRRCLRSTLEAARARLNRSRRGEIGPFRIASVPIAVPGLEPSYLTSINETRLRRSGAVLIHIYRDIFAFVSGPAEVELEAVGFSRPLAASTEKKALATLLERARANASAWR